MKSSLRHRTIPLTLSLAGLLLFGGCTTTTRLGDVFIPKHPDSDQSEGEVVRLELIDEPATPAAMSFSVSSLAVAAAGVAIDWTVDELKREVERYEAQFGSRRQFLTTELTNGRRLVLTRWVDGVLPTDVRSKLDVIAPGLHIPADKDLAFIFVAKLKPLASGNDKSPAIFSLDPSHLWDRRTSAKVVDLHITEWPKFWQWPGALLFKTDNKVSVKIETTIKALVRTTDGAVKPVVLDPSFPIAVSRKTNLNKNTNAADLTDGEVRFGVPLVANDGPNHVGFLSIEFTVTETDASNVRKIVEKGAASLEKRKDSLLGRLVK